MFDRILIALDHSELADTVFAAGLELARKQEAEMHLLHVLTLEEQNSPEPPIGIGVAYYPETDDPFLQAYQEKWENFKQKGLDMLRKRSEDAASMGVKAEYTQVWGRPGRTICTVARDQESQLIILGRRGLSGLSEWFMGSVSNYVLHHAPCSVLVVNG